MLIMMLVTSVMIIVLTSVTITVLIAILTTPEKTTSQ